MNKFLLIIAIAFLALFSTKAFALRTPVSPKPSSAISDISGVLSPEAHARLDAQLAHINGTTANEIAALIVPTLDGESIEDVAMATASIWGIGKAGLDNGVLIVLAMKEHKSRIETGKGVEGDLPDLKCNDILQDVVRPHMQRGDVEGALSQSFDAIASSIANHKAEAIKPTASQNNNWAFLVFGLLCAIGVAALVLMRRVRRKQAEILAEVKRDLQDNSVKFPSVDSYREPAPVETYRPASSYQQRLTPVVSVPVYRPTLLPPSHEDSSSSKSRSYSSSDDDSSSSSSSYSSSSSSDSSSSSSSDWGSGGGGSDFGGGSFGGGGSSDSW